LNNCGVLQWNRQKEEDLKRERMDKGRTKTFTELKKTNRKKKQINSKSFIIDILLNCDQINKIQSVSKPM